MSAVNVVGIGLLAGASVLAIATAVNMHDARQARRVVPKRQATRAAAVTAAAAAWGFALGGWLVLR